MIRKNGWRFSEKIMLKQKHIAGTTIRRKVITLYVPDRILARSHLSVGRNGPPEVVVFLAGNEAEIFQRHQELLGLGEIAQHQIGLAEMLMRAAVAGIQHQRLLIMADSRPQLTQPPIGVADVVLDIGIEWIAQRGELERSDCTIPILRAQ